MQAVVFFFSTCNTEQNTLDHFVHRKNKLYSINKFCYSDIDIFQDNYS